ncbi:N-acetylglucosamine-1-phosphotransferase subunits alpha/beta-like [Stylophora pistillata]|nr:N-acetylglucosamine-1-phosphotransferase subunits alpha/beta-like [Stylophora pistillata]
MFCSPGCADTWVGDRYCDVACNVAQCGFDAGDCGITQFNELYHIDVDQDTQAVNLPRGISVLYFNISTFFSEGRVTSGEYSETHCVRSATVAQKFKVFTLTLRVNCTVEGIHFKIEGFIDKNESSKVAVNLNVTIDTRKLEEIEIVPARNSKTSKLTTTKATTSAVVTPSANAETLPRTIYPIRIQNADRSLNYWAVTGNESITRPTWPPLTSQEYEIPHLSNDTVLPQHVQISLEEVEKEYKDGDLTQKGYARKKAKILREFFTVVATEPAYSPIAVLTAPLPKSGMVVTPPANLSIRQQENRKDKKSTSSELQGHQRTETHTQRKLLSLEVSEIESLFAEIGREKDQHYKATDDEIFLADWIANTKQKQLSFDKDQAESTQLWRSRYGNWSPKVLQSATSFLPWERQKTFEELLRYHDRQKHSQEFTNDHKPGRKLLDTFADSLLHVHRIYNRKFGYMGRKVPAHMPHMVDVKIMEELQSLLPEEFDQTSSHKFRSSEDMQFAFSYNYFVVGQKKDPNVIEFFADVDADHSGVLSEREMRTLAARLYTLPLDLNDLNSLEKTLLRCDNRSVPDTNSSIPSHQGLPLVSLEFLQQCDPLLKLLNDSYKGAAKYKYETVGDEDVAFHMIRDNATAVLRQLDNIRGKKKKFVCLNDNIDHSKKDAELIKALLVDFYESLFPIPSQFELPQGYTNRFLQISELNEFMKERENIKFWTNIILVILVVAAVFSIFPGILFYLIQLLCPFRRLFSLSQRNSSSTTSRLMTV